MATFIKTIVLLFLVATLSSCSVLGVGGKSVTVGGKNFTEQYLLSEMTAFLLREEGFNVKEMNNLGSNVIRRALINGQIDLTWEYTGTALVSYMGKEPLPEAEATFQKVKELDEKNNIHWMNMSEVNNTYVLMMQKPRAKELGLTSISDLANYVKENPGELTFATDVEFANRVDGLPGVEETYGFEFGVRQVVLMELGLTYEALNNGEVDVAMGFETDGRILEYDFLMLEDDKNFFPPYTAAVAIKDEAIEKYPEIEEITAPLAEKLTSDIMRELNYAVDIEGKSVSLVAYDWLLENGLIEE
ncbi:glycine betaine ABC transporter substrate-binding protein [Aureibacillus halotolerans]|uniref:Osmoprotectant transport system substrate-binding protein n=1 Tax=Aureibacillus halotolerans TaxID=1508390 RepID=A0A4R6U700_9BACI|nr:glycine betaine ABC transporter substrate-binding protein [Aureibacillus halotolerans]TDQ42300.1 osmoprotectant transport system substrate-binding protein [Aureibacillus halotolerans]